MSEDRSRVIYRCGRFIIEPAARRLLRDGQPVELEARALDLIVALVEQRDRVVDKPAILKLLWGRRPVTDAALNRIVHKARTALDDDGKRQQAIRTIHGHGLQWVAPIEILDVPALHASAGQPPRRRLRWMLPAGVVVAVLIAVALGWWFFPRTTVAPGSPASRVAIAPLVNATGEHKLDWTEHGLPGLLANLLSDHGDLHVLDATKVSHAWGFAVPKGQSHVAHLRHVTGAGTIITLRMDKLADTLYELDAHVDGGSNYSAFDVSVQGAKPAQLAIALAAHIRHRLGLDPIKQPAFKSDNAYLAETYARGLDAGARTHWPKAKPYFALVAHREPDFLPARMHLAMAQLYTNQQNKAGKTLHALISAATRANKPDSVAGAWLLLHRLATYRGDLKQGVATLRKAAATHGASPATRARVALDTAFYDAIKLRHDKQAAASLQRARHLIDTYNLATDRSALYGDSSDLEQDRGDMKAAAIDEHKALATDTGNGDDGNVAIDDYNLAMLLGEEKRTFGAVTLYARAWQLGEQRHFHELEFNSGLNLAVNLIDLAAVRSAAAPVAEVEQLAQHGDNPLWRSFAAALLALKAGYFNRNAVALADTRKAMAALDKIHPSDSTVVTILLAQSAPALYADPGALDAMAARLKAIAHKHADTHAFDYQSALMDAYAAAADGHEKQVLASLHAAQTAPHPDDPKLGMLRDTALLIALHNRDAIAARLALDGFDMAHCNDAELLQNVAAWGKQSGDPTLARKATTRWHAVRQQARQALAKAGFKLSPLPAVRTVAAKPEH